MGLERKALPNMVKFFAFSKASSLLFVSKTGSLKDDTTKYFFPTNTVFSTFGCFAQPITKKKSKNLKSFKAYSRFYLAPRSQ